MPLRSLKILPIFTLLSLTACSKTLDSEKIAQTIQQDVIKQGGISLKSVTCPRKIEPKANESFDCLGEMDTGYTFTIPVKQKDDQGSVTWDIPNTKGMLNLAKFETTIQESVQGEIGSRPIIRCGGDGYKAVKPGQTFECKVEVKKASNPSKNGQTKAQVVAGKPQPAPSTNPTKPKQPDRIVVAIDADGNISWQRVVSGGVSALLPKPEPTPGQPAGQPVRQAEVAAPAPKAPAPPAQKNAEDFLNQKGAADQFDN